MKREDLVSVIVASAQVSRDIARKTLSSVLEKITDALCKGEAVTLLGFGTFSVRIRKARTGRNPKTGEALKIAASRAAAFKVGKALKNSIQEYNDKE